MDGGVGAVLGELNADGASLGWVREVGETEMGRWEATWRESISAGAAATKAARREARMRVDFMVDDETGLRGGW